MRISSYAILRRRALLAILPLALCVFSSGHARMLPSFVRVSYEVEPSSLDWHQYRTAQDRFFVSFLMRGLMKYDDSATPVCDLCSKVDVSSDRRTYLFVLKEEVWSDGTLLNSQQFVDGFARLLDPKLGFSGAGFFSFMSAADVKAASEKVLEITLQKPNPSLLHLLALPPSFPIRKEKGVGEKVLKQASLGPYYLAEWARGKHLVLERNEASKLTVPVFRFKFEFGSHSRHVARFQKGQLDILSDPTTEDIIAMGALAAPNKLNSSKALEKPKVQVSPFWATRALVFNHLSPKTSNLSLRKSILFHVRREAMGATIRNGERIATGIIPPGIEGSRTLPYTTQSSDTARAERTRVGPIENVITLELVFLEQRVDRQIAGWLREELLGLGVAISLTGLKSRAYYDRLKNGKFDLALRTYAFRTGSCEDLLSSFVTDSPENFSQWTHVLYDSLWKKLGQSQDPAERAPILDQMTQLMEQREVALIALGYPMQTFLLGSRVKAFAMTPFGEPNLVKIDLK